MSLRGFEKSEVIHNIYSFFKNWIAAPLARNDNFNYTYALKNNFASLNNNVAVAHCVNNSEKSAQGVTTPCYSGYAFSYDLKNNFIILNLVKSFLTSINFDSLSERNLCLVIKKIYLQGVCKMKHTKNILKSLLITVMALSLLAVSCKKDEGGSKPTDPITPKNSKTLLTDMLIQLGPLTSTDGSTVVLDFSKISFNGTDGTATIAGADNTKEDATDYKVKTVLDNTFKVENFNREITLKQAPTVNNPTSANKNELSVEITFIANKGYTFDDSITEGTKYKYTASDKTAKLTLKITPAQDWE